MKLQISFRCFVAGLKFGQYQALKDPEELVFKSLDLIPEPENKFDSKAVRVEHSGIKLGYIPKGTNILLSRPLENYVCLLLNYNDSAPSHEKMEIIVVEIL